MRVIDYTWKAIRRSRQATINDDGGAWLRALPEA